MGKDVVKKNQVASAGAAASAPSGDKIGDAAKKLSDASYPFLKGVDWTSDLYIKQLASASYDFAKEVDWNNGIYLQAPGKFQPLEAIKAIDKMIVMGAQADSKLLQAAAEAHHKAIGSVSGANGVTSQAD